MASTLTRRKSSDCPPAAPTRARRKNPEGYGKKRAVTAIGDAVNTSSRLEGLTKELDCAAVVSEEVLKKAGVLLPDLPRREVDIRGRSMPITVVAIADAAELAESA